ncbi:MAG: tripartite tricarboxylate transporter substrate binding protein [Acetobacteraceae bacterium]|nr:tripartite tricarboxylate transporter substrate binding protein [Acetobacteraceae bacterium]
MRPTRRGLAALLCATAGVAGAATPWPDRPVRLIIPGPPGGSSDIMARILADEVARAIGQPMVIEPKPGVGGNLATDHVARAQPDGYTLLFGDIGPLAINPALFANLTYDPVRDFDPIAQVALFPWIIVAHPSLPARTLEEVMALARRTPGGLAYATPGIGTPSHLTGAILSEKTGGAFIHVPYRGGGPATTDVLAGQVKLGILGLPPVAQHLRSGALRGIAVSTAARSPTAPEVPGMAESGLPGFDAAVWYGVLAPHGTGSEVIARMNAALGRALADPAVRQRLQQQGVSPAFSSPEAFAALIRAEITRWAPVVRAAGARIE